MSRIDELEVLTDLPFAPNARALREKLHLEEDSEENADFENLLATARQVARPKAIYRVAYVEARGDGTVTLSGVTFASRVLRANLDQVGRVFAYVATCGGELDGINLPADDLIKKFWLEAIKAAALGCAAEALHERLGRRYALGKTATMSPGSGDASVWPIEQQKALFALFGNVKELIGVRLTDTFLMLPNKSISGIRFPTEREYKSCKLCRRANCPSRSAPFDAELAKSLGHEPDAAV